MLKEIKGKDKTKLICAIIFSIFGMFLTANLCKLVYPIQIDDTMYADWVNRDFKYFIEKNIWHFYHFNARMLIHILFQLTLFLNLYSIIIPISIFAFGYFGTKILNPDWNLSTRLFSVGILEIGFYIINVWYLKEILFWMAGSFNYIVPLAIITACFYYAEKLKEKDKKYIIISIILAFITGATTEQCGMYGVGLFTMKLLFDILDKKGKETYKKDIILLISVILGYLTIFTSPAIAKRTFAEKNESGLLQMMIQCHKSLVGENCVPATMLILGSLFTISGMLKSKWFILGIPVIIINYFSYINHQLVIPIFTTITFMTIIITVMICKKDMRKYGVLMLCGYGTIIMTSITKAVMNRTTTAFFFSIILFIVSIFCDKIRRKDKKTISVIMVITICILGFSNYNIVYNGAMETYQKFTKPIIEAFTSDDKCAELTIRYDDLLKENSEYRYHTFLDIANQLEAMKRLHKKDIVDIHFISDNYDVYNVYIDGISSEFPVIKINGEERINMYALTKMGYEDYFLPLKIKNGTTNSYGFIKKNNTDKYIVDETKNVLSYYTTINGVDVLQKEIEFIKQEGASIQIGLIPLKTICDELNAHYKIDELNKTYYITTK